MKVNVMGLLRQAASSAKQNGNPGLAHLLLEFGNNLRTVMRGEETLEAFKAVYVGSDAEPFDIDKLLPATADT